MLIYTNSPEETKKLGFHMSKYLHNGDIILLSGDLGAGKTLFTKGLGLGLEIKEPVTSPTFTLMHEYEGRLPLYHFDLYRIEDPEELIEVGLLDYMYGDGVTVVEWFEKMDEYPPEYIKIKIFVEKIDQEIIQNRRRLEFFAKGSRYDNIVKKIEKEKIL